MIVMRSLAGRLSLVLASLGAAAFAPTTWAATLYVDASAPCPGLGTQADPYCTIQAGINAAVNGDVVEVAPGTYLESITFAGKRITVRGAAGAAATTIDSTTLAARAVQMQAGETRQSVLEGFTVTGGAGAGGLIMTGGASATIKDCVFTGCVAPHGGSMYIDAGSPLVQRCVFTGNSATQTQNVSGGAVLNFRGSTSVFEDCAFEDNTGTLGGAMYCSTSPVTIRRCEFRGNVAAVYGGAIDCFSSSIAVEDSLFDDNEAGPTLGNGSGGAVRTFGGSPTFTRCTFTGNTANQGNAVEHEGSASPTYTDCLFENNSGGLGGGAMFSFQCFPVIERCVLRGNSAVGSGGAIYASGGSLALRNSLLVGNSGAGFGGGAVLVVSGASAQIVNCTFAGNSSIRSGGVHAYGTTPQIRNCVFWGNTAPTSPQVGSSHGGAPVVERCNIQGGWSGAGGSNIDADPMFADAPNGDYTVPSGSPCVDAGDNAFVHAGVTLDLALGARFFDDPATADTGAGTGPIVDLGAHELSFVVACAGDLNGDGFVNSADLGGLLGSWGPGAGPADINGDGMVGSPDLAALLGSWGPCP